MSRIPAHVQTAIETRLGLPLGLASGYAKPGHCPKCGRAVIAGYDAPAIAGLAVVDPCRLTMQLEAAAIILRRPTYQLHGRLRFMLSNRTWPGVPKPWPLKSADQAVVVAAHKCGHHLGGEPISATNPAARTFPPQPNF